MPDAQRLLAAVADALNAAERAGLAIENLQAGVVWTRAGYVVPFGDDRLGCRWLVRARTEYAPRAEAGEGLSPPHEARATKPSQGTA